MLKDGDRFFFTHSEGPKAKGLPLEIQEMILQRTLSDIICQNTEQIEELPKNVFLLSDTPVSCEQRPDLDFNAIARILSGGKEEESPASASSTMAPEYPKTEAETEAAHSKIFYNFFTFLFFEQNCKNQVFEDFILNFPCFLDGLTAETLFVKKCWKLTGIFKICGEA